MLNEHPPDAELTGEATRSKLAAGIVPGIECVLLKPTKNCSHMYNQSPHICTQCQLLLAQASLLPALLPDKQIATAAAACAHQLKTATMTWYSIKLTVR